MATAGIILVTGAARGIGLEVVRQLASQGMAPILSARSSKQGHAAQARLREAGLSVDFLEMDVRDPGSVRQAARRFGSMFERLDVLVHNAGILLDGNGSILHLDWEVIHETLRTNLYGPIAVTQAFLPLLRKGRRPRVIHVSSAAGSLQEMQHWAPAYSISKTALNAATRQWASALQSDGIAVNSVSPGWVRTEMGGANAPRGIPEGAQGIVWLATDAPQDLSGSFLRDGQTIPW